MKVIICWVGDVKFEVEFGFGYIVIIDGLLEYGGNNQGVCFMELMLLGVGGCFVFDVMYILKKFCQDVIDCVIQVFVECVDVVFVVFEFIYLYFLVSGCGLKEVQVKWVVELFVEKYCLVFIMLLKVGVNIIYSYEIIEVV